MVGGVMIKRTEETGLQIRKVKNTIRHNALVLTHLI